MANLNFGKPQNYIGWFGEGLAIVAAIWVIGWLATLVGYTAPSIDAMISAFTTFDWMAILVQVIGAIVLAIVYNAVIKPLKDQIF